MNVKVNIDATELLDMIDQFKNDYEEIKDKIEAFNDKYFFAKLKLTGEIADSKKLYESCLPMMKILYGVL